MRLILEEQQKYLQSFVNNATYHPHEPWCWCYISDSHKCLFSSHKYLLYFGCSTLHSIKPAQHCLYNSGKGRCTRYIGAMICLYFGIVFLLFLMKIENTVYMSFLDFWHHEHLSEYKCYHHLDLSMIEGFHGFEMFSFSLSNAKETLQKMLTRKCSYCGRIEYKCWWRIGNKC